MVQVSFVTWQQVSSALASLWMALGSSGMHSVLSVVADVVGAWGIISDVAMVGLGLS